MSQRLPYETIVKASEGDQEAVAAIFKPAVFMEIIMDRTFQKFLQSKIDLSSVGVEFREDNAPYFCTHKGASIFGWAGVDGIHFCFIRGFGSMVLRCLAYAIMTRKMTSILLQMVSTAIRS